MLLDQSSTNIKLIDFGLARRLTDKEDMRAMMGTAEFIGNDHQGHLLVVTARVAMINMVVSLWKLLVAAELSIHGREPFP